MSKTLVSNVVSLANAAEFIKQTIRKVGLEYIAPLQQPVQDEKISKALSKRAMHKETQQ